MSLYLKYRPKTIAELDLDSVRQTLGEIVKSNNLAHAYFFTGPRGAGKTSAARILARIINCEHNAKKLGEPCNECDACQAILDGTAVDVSEIDAASNRGIDDIRELKERIRLAPTTLRKKVYIIDEVHMLTTEAFNALLKTLEEPPSHAIFILCTTEAHKVPETIASRCVKVTFTKATKEEMKRSFARVVAGEQAEIEDEAIDLIAKSVDGSFRDGVKILDTVLGLGHKIATADVERVLYGASGYSSKILSQALASRELTKALEAYHLAIKNGIELTYLLVSVMRDLRDIVVGQTDASLVPLIRELDKVARKIALSPVPELLVEVTIVEWCGRSSGSASRRVSESASQQIGESVDRTVSKPDRSYNRKTQQSGESEAPDNKNDNIMETVIEPVQNVSEPIGSVDAVEAWNKLIASLSGESYSLGALLAKARPGNIRGNILTIEMQHDFHREQLMQEKFRAKVEELVSQAVGQKMRIECVIRQSLQSAPHIDTIAQVDPEENELLEAAEEIFSPQG